MRTNREEKIRSSVSGLLIVVLSSLAISCNDDFLEVGLQAGVSPDTDPRVAEFLVTGAYNSLLQGDSWGNGDVHGFAFLSVSSIMSDDADKGSTPSDQSVPVGDIDNFTITPTNKFAETLWRGHYNGIASTNHALKALAVANFDEDLINQYKGESRFLRAYFYFNLVRMFGGVPLVMRVPVDADDANSDPIFQTRATAAVVYDSIIKDLEYAAAHLPLKGTLEAGRANKGAAHSLLAKVYMYKASNPDNPTPNADWQKVYDFTDSVITSAKYTLVDDYATIWRQVGDNNSESIFEIQTGDFNNANLGPELYTVTQGPRQGGMGGWDDLGWGFNIPSAGLLDAYEEGDNRKAGTIIFIDDSETHAGTTLWDGFRIPSKDSVENLYYNYKAYTSREKEKFANAADKNRPKNIRIMRFAEVLLMNAEAAVHLGIGDPDEKVNLVRDRAGLDPKSGVTIADIWHERRIELAMEHDRFWDIVRQGNAETLLHAAGKTNFVAGKHELLPIPVSQILLSNNLLDQNPGY